MSFDLRAELAKRPWWMNLAFAFCLYMTFVYVPYDFFFKPTEADQEVWFGFVLRGVAAKLTEPLHWAIYAAGAYGLWRMKSWLWPWASLYVAQIAIGMLVWNLGDERGMGVLGGAVSAIPFAALAVAFWRKP